MTTLLHTSEGAVPMHTAIENESNIIKMTPTKDKAIEWEALRGQCVTIKDRAALDRLTRGNVLFDYLWFVLAVTALILILSKLGGLDEPRDPEAGSHIPAEVKGGHSEGLR